MSVWVPHGGNWDRKNQERDENEMEEDDEEDEEIQDDSDEEIQDTNESESDEEEIQDTNEIDEDAGDGAEGVASDASKKKRRSGKGEHVLCAIAACSILITLDSPARSTDATTSKKKMKKQQDREGASTCVYSTTGSVMFMLSLSHRVVCTVPETERDQITSYVDVLSKYHIHSTSTVCGSNSVDCLQVMRNVTWSGRRKCVTCS